MILVVDDEPLIREVLGELLADEGYLVGRAADGQEALDQVDARPPDLIVSDVTMPRIGGVELVRRLRARGLSVPVILVSANYAMVDLPGVRFVAKPFDFDHLMDVIERSLLDGAA